MPGPLPSALPSGWPIPLTAEEFRLIGELCAVQGQIEQMMILVVSKLLDVSVDLCRNIMGSTAIANNTKIWSDVIESKSGKQWMKDVSKIALTDIKNIAEGRNDFVHAVFGWDAADDALGMSPGVPATVRGPTIAVRIRSRKWRPISDLPGVREEAARVSRMIAHVHWGLTGDEPSPWRGKF